MVTISTVACDRSSMTSIVMIVVISVICWGSFRARVKGKIKASTFVV